MEFRNTSPPESLKSSHHCIENLLRLESQCSRATNGSPIFPASRWSAWVISNANINGSYAKPSFTTGAQWTRHRNRLSHRRHELKQTTRLQSQDDPGGLQPPFGGTILKACAFSRPDLRRTAVTTQRSNSNHFGALPTTP